jgi:hypothetical protein
MLLTLWLPPRIEGRVLVSEALPPSAEDWAGQLFHTQQERSLPTLNSTPVTMTKPTRNEITPATRLPTRRERRRAGGMEENLENGNLNLRRNLPHRDFFLKPPGMLVTAPGTRAK